jgi:hypothetical protein
MYVLLQIVLFVGSLVGISLCFIYLCRGFGRVLGGCCRVGFGSVTFGMYAFLRVLIGLGLIVGTFFFW